MTSDDWVDKIFLSNDVEELTDKYEKILYNSENGVIISIGISNDQCMEFCYHYFRSRRGKDVNLESLAYIESFLAFMADYLDEHLQEEDLDFLEDYEG